MRGDEKQDVKCEETSGAEWDRTACKGPSTEAEGSGLERDRKQWSAVEELSDTTSREDDK